MQSPSFTVAPTNVVASVVEALVKPMPRGQVEFVMLWHSASIRKSPAGQLRSQQMPWMRVLVGEAQGGAVLAMVE